MSNIEWVCLIVLTALNAALVGMNRRQEQRARKACDHAHQAHIAMLATWAEVQAERARPENKS